ncbi:histidinol-phosphate transaminase [bacterium]|nr:MAG: histidinol-phosphate transaminase [bacterium]
MKFAVVPEHIRDLQPYKAGKTLQEVLDVYKPERIAKLASNENRMGCSPAALKAAQDTFGQIMNYPDPSSRALRAEIAKMHGIKPENVIAGNGSEGVMSLITRTFFKDTDQALTAAGTFIGFWVLINSRGVKLVKVPLTQNYAFDLQALADAITEETRVVYLANPNNPTGTYFTKQEFEWFMTQVPEHVLVIMDEAYYEYAKDEPNYPDSMRYRMDNVITLRTFSKGYGLAGFRVGYGMAHEDLIGNLMKVKLPFEPGSPSQAAALAALRDTEFIERSVELVLRGKERLYAFLDKKGMNYVKSASNSVMMVFDNENDAAHFTDKMLERGVVLRHLPAFGIPEGVRITIGLEEDMTQFEWAFEQVVK